MNNFLFPAIFACFAILASSFVASAQSPGFTVSPVKSFLQLHRGEVHGGTFEIINKGADPLPLQVVVDFFGVSDELGSITFGESPVLSSENGNEAQAGPGSPREYSGQAGRGIAGKENPEAWLQLDPPFLLVAPGEFRSIPYTMTVPKDAAFGTYTLAAIFQSKFPAAKDAAPHAQLLPAIGSLFFTDILPAEGELVPEGVSLHISDFSIPAEKKVAFRPFGASLWDIVGLQGLSFSFVEKNPIELTVRIQNDGSYIAKPRGMVTVKDMFGRVRNTSPLPEGAILPGTSRRFTIALDVPSRVPLWFLMPAFVSQSILPGRYTAALSLSPSTSKGEGAMLSQTLPFWAFPRLLTLSTVLATAMLFFVLKYRGRFLIAYKVFRARNRA